MGAQPRRKAFAGTARFTPVVPARPVRVLADGRWLQGKLNAINGPRMQVTIEQDGQRYRRWVDADDVHDGDVPGPATTAAPGDG